MAQDDVVFAGPGVVVTETNLNVKGETFSLSQVVTAHVEKKGLSRGLWVVVLAVAGLVTLLSWDAIGGNFAGVLGIGIVLAAILYGENRPSYQLLLRTTRGTTLNPFTTKDEELAYQVRDALDLAIAAGVPSDPAVAGGSEDPGPEPPSGSPRRAGMAMMAGGIFLAWIGLAGASSGEVGGPIYLVVILGLVLFFNGFSRFRKG